ncbi:LysR substrate-binding domain-containing protein [Ramlibacter sp.]|uniref:LysR substrate-binding domain-containing protein n=1 Tax=Ramlibacter sp. TaxID=1917967 RepID=UPI003D0B3BEE
MQTAVPPRAPHHRLPALRAFEAVSRHLSVTRAAEELFVTPGAVSQQVRQLEASLGTPLLERHHRRVSLTPDGAKLAFCLSSCFERIDRTLLEISGGAAGGVLSLRLMPTFAIRWLVPRLSRFYGAYPGIELEIATQSATDDHSMVNVDIAVRLGTGDWADAASDFLFADDLVPVCAPAVAKTLRRPADLKKATLIHSAARTEGWPVWLEAFGVDARGFTRNLQLANAALACQAALDGLGVAITQREYVAADLASGQLVAPFPSYGRSELGYWLVCPRHKADWPNVRQFRAWARSIAKPRSSGHSLPPSNR